jgi:type IV pilus assembly protein PilB
VNPVVSQSASKRQKAFADALVSKKLLTEHDLERAQTFAYENHVTLVEAIVTLKLLPAQIAYEEMASVYGVPFVDLTSYSPDPTAVSLLDEKLARELVVIPLFVVGDTLTVACADIEDVTLADRISNATNYQVEFCLATREDILNALSHHYAGRSGISELVSSIHEADAVSITDPALESAKSSISQFVDLLITQAVRDRASDIHIDPEESTMRIRFRIDGFLHDIPAPPKYLHPFIVSRVKIMSGMDIAETRLPQDGRFQITVDGRPVEGRVASMATVHGEKVTIRLLDRHVMAIPLDNLGIAQNELPKVHELVKRKYGMVIVTGPTGSGKTTTLYAMLSEARASDRHIVSIEDPVERRIRNVNQLQVNEKAGFGFDNALRSILRHDPDVIMVGEIRDEVTAQLAVRAALSGHLILSTLHTNDAPSAVVRLLNMGVPSYLLGSCLTGVIAQRLVRCICKECKVKHEIAPELRKSLIAHHIKLPKELWIGKGCQKCRNIGYRDRTGIFETLIVTPRLSALITEGASLARIRTQARKDGMITLLEDALAKVSTGVTSLEEVFRVVEIEDLTITLPAEPAELQTEQPPAEKTTTVSKFDLEEYRTRIADWLGSKR